MLFRDQYSVVFGEFEIGNMVSCISNAINYKYKKYPTNNKITIIPILDAAFMFVSDLSKQLELDITFKFVKVVSYFNGEPTTPKICSRIEKEDISGNSILIVDTIIDSGNTIRLVRNRILELCPWSIDVCALIVKNNDLNNDIKVSFPHYSGVDGFLFGYGTDYKDGSGRNLDYICKNK